MSNLDMACCLSPTRVVVIDDQEMFLDSLTTNINPDISTKLFSNPFDGLEYLKECKKANFILGDYLKSLKDRDNVGDLERDMISHAYTDIDVFEIHKTVYNPDRFNITTVVIVDYDMPGMSGLDVCRALKGYPFKFIMLTGRATPETVIQGFNEGLIHRYVSKDAREFYYELHNAIYDLEKMQFQELSKTIINSLSASPVCCLGDQMVAMFFDKFCQDNNIVEYYLVNESGCFLLLDIKGNVSWFVIRNEREMQEHTEVATDNEAPQELIDALRQRKQVLFLFTEEDDSNVPVSGWGDYMHTSTKMEGLTSNYYYAHVKGVNNYKLDMDKVRSYQDFLANEE
jgi:CheY-like chemotaxis protein